MRMILPKSYLEPMSKEFSDIEFYQIPEDCLEADSILGMADMVTEQNLERLPNLKWIQLLSAGYDSIDLDYLKKRNIILTNAKGIYSIPIAEDVVCKILMSNCNTLKYLENQKKGEWNKGVARYELCGQTVSIIGTGSIATEIAKRLQAFSVRVIGYKRTPISSHPYFDKVYIGEENLNYMLSISDYVVLTVDLNKDTYHMINKDNLKHMKQTASIINIARGSVINQKDLTEVLKENKIKYAGLDVFEMEPLSEDDELWKLDNVYITPHSSANVKNNKKRIYDLIIDNINRYKDGEDLINIVK